MLGGSFSTVMEDSETETKVLVELRLVVLAFLATI
jgi:hypothetical protein